jgi:hypothetical protein
LARIRERQAYAKLSERARELVLQSHFVTWLVFCAPAAWLPGSGASRTAARGRVGGAGRVMAGRVTR